MGLIICSPATCTGLVPRRWQVAGRAPKALQQGTGAHPAQEEEQHAVVRDAGRAPEGNLLHQGDQEAGGEEKLP